MKPAVNIDLRIMNSYANFVVKKPHIYWVLGPTIA